MIEAWAAIAVAAEPFEGTLRYRWAVTGDSVGLIAATTPAAMIIAVRGEDAVVTFEGGQIPFDRMIVHGRDQQVYALAAATMEGVVSTFQSRDLPPFEVTPEDEVLEIAGYPCRKHRVVNTATGVSSYVWTPDAFMVEPGDLWVSVVAAGSPGVPFKATNVSGDIAMTLTIESVDRKRPKKSVFEVPKGYAITVATP